MRRFRISADGTRRLISVTSGLNTTKASDKPTDTCIVEPFYVPVNTRIKNNDSNNFWDNGSDEETKNGQMSLSMSVAKHKRRAASALNKTISSDVPLEKPKQKLNTTGIADETS